MTEDKYTIEQIREANFRMLETVFEDDPFTDTTDALITELQRPAWVPAVGEVYAAGKGSSCYVFHGKGFLPATGGRPLTLTEHGRQVRDLLEAVEAGDIPGMDIAAKALRESSGNE